MSSSSFLNNQIPTKYTNTEKLKKYPSLIQNFDFFVIFRELIFDLYSKKLSYHKKNEVYEENKYTLK